MNFRIPITISIFTSLLTIYSCSLLTEEIVPDSPSTLLKEGIRALKLDQPLRSQALFEQLVEDFPDSKERKDAMLLIARSHYSFEQYEEAKFHFQKFIDLYPAHKNADRAYFFKAMSDYQRIDIASRDQTATKEAQEGFQQLIDEFPKSPYLKLAKQNLIKCDLMIAKNIFEVGKFYYRTGSYLSAITRFKTLKKDHSKQKFFDEATFLLAESYYHEQSFKEALLLYKKFIKEYPRSQFTIKAKKRLRSLRSKSYLK
ncbi:MAG: outer membrane protein assembly factor BamD [Nitrospina sp.]|jgi:outer membrane protein assembly factor BamD|nr:outer membrane protein assembly factor BamD [Nitrospina sp.]MBT6600876.1 outer membrane protein assembly factor BamD [Nitrospina sp.]